MGSKGSEWNEPSVDKPSQDETIPRDLCWDGVTKADTKDPEGLHVRNHLASLAKSCSWAEMLDLLAEYPPLVNASRPNGKWRYAPLHQAAYGGAPIEVVDRLLKLGAFRTLRSSSDSRPVDIARNRSHVHLVPILQLDCKRHVPAKVLSKLQANFHEVIRGRVNELVQEKALRLPELDIRHVRDVSGHSFRSGHVSQAVRNGVPEYIVMKQTGHKSREVLSAYIRIGEMFEQNAARRLWAA